MNERNSRQMAAKISQPMPGLDALMSHSVIRYDVDAQPEARRLRQAELALGGHLALLHFLGVGVAVACGFRDGLSPRGLLLLGGD